MSSYISAIDPNKSNEVVVVVTSAQDGGSLTLKDHIHQSSTTLPQQPVTVTYSEPLLIVDQRSYRKTQPMMAQPQTTNIIARKNLATDFMASAMEITAMTTNVMATTAMATNAMATNAIATVSMEKNPLGTNSIEHISIPTVPIASHSMEKACQPMKQFPTERSPKILVNHRRYNSSSPIATHSARRTPNSLHSIPLTPMSAHSTTSSMTPTNLLDNANTMPRSVEYTAFALRQSSQQTLSEPEASEILLRRQKGRNSKSFKTDAPSLFGQGATTSPNQGRKRSYSDSIEAPRSKSVDTSPKDGNAFKCGQCGKTFPQRSVLQIHVCPKQPYKPYHCGHCNRLFDDPNELRNHAMIHSNEKPFKCGYCSRSFSGATTLNNHIRTHTGEKPFECSLCGKTFSQASQLSRHEKIPGDCI